MSTRAPDLWSTIAAIAAITIIICVGLHYGMNHTLAKLGIVAISGIAGFTFRGLIRRNP